MLKYLEIKQFNYELLIGQRRKYNFIKCFGLDDKENIMYRILGSAGKWGLDRII